MDINNIPFGITNWAEIPTTCHTGDQGYALWRTQQFDAIRVRMVEYSENYLADHWCSKGHILLCLEGELHTELDDGRSFTLTAGMKLPSCGSSRSPSLVHLKRCQTVYS